MKIEIVREKRKTISLRVVDSENAILKAPMRISDKKINEFLADKEKWLKKTSLKMKENESFEREFNPLENAFLCGKYVGRFSDLVPKFDKMNDENKTKAIKNFYLSHFSDVEVMAKSTSQQVNIAFSSVKPTKSHRIWGSFNRQKEMKLNIFLVALPSELARYVIVHELCHSLQMNHSPKFWSQVERFEPNYKVLKKQLSKFSFLLRL